MCITLKAARVNAALTQEAAAERLGISRKTLQNWESGFSVPNVLQAQKIQELYNYPADHIIF